MKFEPEKDTRRILVIVAASVIMALNIKTFVRTGDLFPGGATGLTLLFQRAARMFFHVEIPYTVLNVAISFTVRETHCANCWQELRRRPGR